MKTIKLGNHTIEMYDSIENLPMIRFHKYNKCMMVDAGVGDSVADFDRHIEKTLRYIKTKKTDLAVAELENMRNNIFMMQENISPRSMAFAVLVKSIDGNPCDDLSDDGIKKVCDKLSDVSFKEFTSLFEEVKKKIDEELQLYFPKIFDDSTVKEFYDELRNRTLVVLDSIINGDTEDKRAEIDRITTELITYSKPGVFSGPGSIEITYDKQFDRMCIVLSQHLHVDPKRYTVMEYYNAFEYIQEMIKEQRKAARR